MIYEYGMYIQYKSIFKEHLKYHKENSDLALIIPKNIADVLRKHV